MMTRLVEALGDLGLEGEVTHAGHWLRLEGRRFPVYVVEVAWNGGYYTWCDGPGERAVEYYRDPTDAIEAGMRRAA